MIVPFHRFVNFACASDLQKRSIALEISRMPFSPYSVCKDPYRPCRVGLARALKTSDPTQAFRREMEAESHNRNGHLYRAVADGFGKGVGNRLVGSVASLKPQTDWACEDLIIRIKPELHLNLGGVPHLLKTHFKLTPLSHQQVLLLTYLLRNYMPALPGTTVGVFDFQRGVILNPTIDSNLEPFVRRNAIHLRGLLDEFAKAA